MFVSEITQQSHRLLEHLTLLGALETSVLFLAICWVCIYTCWSTNWLNAKLGNRRVGCESSVEMVLAPRRLSTVGTLDGAAP